MRNRVEDGVWPRGRASANHWKPIGEGKVDAILSVDLTP